MTTRTAALAWEALFRTQVTLMRRFEAARDFEPLSSREYDVLFNLSRMPDGAARLRDLNAQLLISQPSLSRMVDRLAGAGLVARREADDDGRGVVVALTPAGAELQKQIGRRHVRHIGALVDNGLDEADQAALARICEKLQAAVTDAPTPTNRIRTRTETPSS
ncbi:MarR family winged helix-turn-helix transcriptional regulator [Occultella gossypii]|uniref:Winged helix-turn-helix transcriptional regulator n=1 Tax=Occultella gossypii TaxID=2800820 RepID=A0ABS7S7B3_9MICO|nr:MarR family winged helix-turn-helix transcriptional regulator [Occultella gossypii]MBZ2195191.1 winged helix-turn-helix transcriptional regulator [Occultella gossypii]